MILLRSSVIAEAVTAITGIALVAGSVRSTASASMPLMPGSWISIRISAGLLLASQAGRLPRAFSASSSAVAVELKHIAHQLAALVVVFDDQDQFVCHGL